MVDTCIPRRWAWGASTALFTRLARTLGEELVQDFSGRDRRVPQLVPEKAAMPWRPQPLGRSFSSNAFDNYYGGQDTSTVRTMVAISSRWSLKSAAVALACVSAYSALSLFRHLEDTTNCNLDHSISTLDMVMKKRSGKDYWIGRNSWEHTGRDGWFRIVKWQQSVEKVAWMTQALN